MGDTSAKLLLGQLNKTVEQLDRISAYYEKFQEDFSQSQLKSEGYDLVILSDIITDYYTCLETIFVRISKFFENNLEKERWHKHLLEKMILEIPGIRKAVLKEETYRLLDEFLRFRHFKRYYYNYHYDRDRMEFLEKKLIASLPLVKRDLAEFKNFLSQL